MITPQELKERQDAIKKPQIKQLLKEVEDYLVLYWVGPPKIKYIPRGYDIVVRAEVMCQMEKAGWHVVESEDQHNGMYWEITAKNDYDWDQ